MAIANYWWLASGAAAIFCAFVHLIAGHYDPVRPFMATEMKTSVKSVMYACWHMVTIVLFSTGFWLILSAFDRDKSLSVGFISVQYILFAFLFLWISWRWKLPNLWFSLPQWILLLPVGLLGLAGVL
ncbi:hypothetical protein [Vibrio nigripulchritudo]|uniref:hypothetical protein n=1 Tax=Vibrio nigripulchritudo TaxID=28173 RepID=UPI0005FA2187|nr:hypothetical protein [Vibrio nigripulchritudo]KJY79757.1 hypothetical protein TW74_08170 [Vibrio nigripulchritudo]